MERRLAAILVTDVVGYSRLMSEDEAGTLARLNAHRNEFIDPKIAEHRGHVVKLTGDGALVEFASVVDAVLCAVDIQRGMAERNSKAPENRRILLRIGVNLGDVIVEGDDIYGDGVNVAARLQELADPGGICVSGTGFEQVDGKIDYVFADLGDRQVKNIAKPVRVYRVRLADPSSITGPRAFFDLSSDKEFPITGGCLCGDIRYEIGKPAISIQFCHCRICQRWGGAPVIASAAFPRDSVRFTRGAPKYYRSSPIAERGFCANCGSSLIYNPLVPQWSDWLTVRVASLDNPESFAPTWHLGIESQMPWLHLHDDLPRVRCEESPELVEAYASVERGED